MRIGQPMQHSLLQSSGAPPLATEQRGDENHTAYYADYKGHGQSKTAFELRAPGQPFHEMILKVAIRQDKEPEVFRAMPGDVTSRILYECDGFHRNTRYHCWITEQAIPFDESARDPTANKQQ